MHPCRRHTRVKWEVRQHVCGAWQWQLPGWLVAVAVAVAVWSWTLACVWRVGW